MIRRTAAAVLAIAALAAGTSGARGSASREGGAFRIVLPQGLLDSLDPALSYTPPGWSLLGATCAQLMTYRDENPPEGFRLVPEVARTYPKASRDSKTFTFTLRAGFRFSDGTPVRANAFARAINRTLAKGVTSAGAQYTSAIVGAARVRAGKATGAVGVVAQGNRLTIRFTRPVPDFAAQTTMPFFCAVPPTLPSDPEGIAVFPQAGPYHVTDYRPGIKAVLERNPYYGGTRPHHVDRFEVDLQAPSPDDALDRIERGDADWGHTPPSFLFNPQRRLIAKYGINKSRFFVQPGLGLNAFALNASRPLFRDNPRLRRAVNFAIDRSALQRATGGPYLSTLTDQYLPPTLPGFNDAKIYPLRHANVQKARELAHGSTRSGTASLWTIDSPETLAAAQTVKRQLAKIGLRVTITTLSIAAYFPRAAARNAAADIAFVPWLADYLDPYSYLNVLLDSRFIGANNFAHYHSPAYDTRLRVAATLKGPARYGKYGSLDVQLARDEAPMAAIQYLNAPTLVSARVGCVVLRPTLDLTTVCIK